MSRPSPPRVVYQGPSQAEVQAQQQAMARYQEESNAQQAMFRQQLQQQIDDATRQAQATQQQIQAMASTAGSGAQAGYSVDVSQQEPVSPQVTESVEQRQKPRSSLVIAPGGVTNTAGTGLNIGV